MGRKQKILLLNIFWKNRETRNSLKTQFDYAKKRRRWCINVERVVPTSLVEEKQRTEKTRHNSATCNSIKAKGKNLSNRYDEQHHQLVVVVALYIVFSLLHTLCVCVCVSYARSGVAGSRTLRLSRRLDERACTICYVAIYSLCLVNKFLDPQGSQIDKSVKNLWGQARTDRDVWLRRRGETDSRDIWDEGHQQTNRC